MTFTTRDKILLGVLAVILFVGMMYLYGVMPANEEADDLAGQVTQKQQELAQLQAQIASINIGALDEEYDKLLDYYYSEKYRIENGGGILPDLIGKVALERMIVAFLDESGIEGYSTTSWSINEERLTGAYGEYSGNYYIAYATCPTAYTCSPEQIKAFIDAVNESEFYTLSSLSIQYSERTVDDGTDDGTGDGTDDGTGEPVEPVTEPVATGNFTLMYYMAASRTAADVPALLDSVDITAAEGASVTFAAVENAVEYEFYFLSSDGTWQLIESIGMDDTGAESYTYTFSPRFLNPGEYTVAVRAVGDKEEGWFKSALPGCDAALDTVTVVVA